jgi:hypothetical protein
MEKSKPKHALREALDFSLEELALNQQGRVGDLQRSRLGKSRNRWFALHAILTVVWVLAIRNCGFSEGDYNRIGNFILISIPLTLFYLLSLLKWVQYSLDVFRGEAHASEGMVQLDVSAQTKGGVRYKLICGEQKFEVSKPVFLAFKNLESYQIFYVPYSKTILSAEWLRE